MRWKDLDKDYLKENYKKHTVKEMALHLHRSYCSVRTMCNELRLYKNKEEIKKICSRPNNGQFKKGNLPYNTKEDNKITMRLDSRGRMYYWIRISLKKWMLYHIYLWLQAGKTIPDGYKLRFINGDSLKCELSNLQLVTMGTHLKMNKALSGTTVPVKEAKKISKKVRKQLLRSTNNVEKVIRRNRTEVENEKRFAKKFLEENKPVFKPVDTSALTQVRIDRKTIIWVKPGSDIDKIRMQYVKK